MTTTAKTTLKKLLAELESLGDEKVRKHNRKDGAGDAQYGVKLGDIRKIAERTKGDRALIDALWATGNLDARLLAILWMKPKELTRDELDALVRSVGFVQAAEWLIAYVAKKHPEKEALREAWMKAKQGKWAARAGWSLTAERVAKAPESLDLPALLERIDAELPKAAPEVQWTMNACLAQIGIHAPKLRKRAVAIGEAHGVYRDYPTSKGCTSPFAPIWIAEMVRRQAEA